MSKCLNCGIEFETKRADAKTCSPKCRKDLHNKRSIGTDKRSDGTLNAEFVEHLIVPEVFKFTIVQSPDPTRYMPDKDKVREAKYWYDVPLAAVPIVKKGWPTVPADMHGRQYFLWWKNEFKTTEDGTPVIHNPLPNYGELKYKMGGASSRHWGV